VEEERFQYKKYDLIGKKIDKPHQRLLLIVYVNVKQIQHKEVFKSLLVDEKQRLKYASRNLYY